MLELPYAGNALSFFAVLPEAPDSLPAVERRWAKEGRTRLARTLAAHPASVDVTEEGTEAAATTSVIMTRAAPAPASEGK